MKRPSTSLTWKCCHYCCYHCCYARAGSSKLVIQTVEVKDRQGLVGEAPGLEPGMVVSAWNPDESWVQDALLRVNATKGVPTLDLNVWSLVDVMVHPLGVHIHQQVANSLWVRPSPNLSYTCCCHNLSCYHRKTLHVGLGFKAVPMLVLTLMLVHMLGLVLLLGFRVQICQNSFKSKDPCSIVLALCGLSGRLANQLACMERN